MEQVRLAVDIGGTFTDAVVEQGGRLTSAKVPTTAEAPEEGFLEAALQALTRAGIGPGQIGTIIHGTTLATNALIERKGARTALITTEGFRDSLEIGYEARFDQYDLGLEKAPPLVARRLRFTVPERVNAAGEVLTALDEGALAALAPRLQELGVEAVAIGFLHAYANPAHEQRAGAILGAALPELSVTLSAEVCPEIREYERLSTATANAYVQPLMARYLRRLARALGEEGFAAPLFLVTSAGGMTDLETAVRFPLRLVESGPSGGAVLAKVMAARLNEPKLLSYDMGGTTAKICLIEDFAPTPSRSFEVARQARFVKGSGLPLRLPVIDMIEVGAGGGSIARLDALGRVAVGPESAGAAPGPACYGRGGAAPTVTDADLALGRLDPTRFAEGRMRLDREASARAIRSSFGDDLAPETTAGGICEMVDETMANAARVHAAEHGKTLGDWALIAFGGAGPLHAGRLAEKLGIRKIIVPPNPGVGSAVGFLQAPISYEVVRSRYTRLSQLVPDDVARLFAELDAEATAVVRRGAPETVLLNRRSALMRYCGQGHEIEVELPEGDIGPGLAEHLRDTYERCYRGLYGRTLPEGEIEALSWSLTVATPEARPEAIAAPCSEGGKALLLESRRIFQAEQGRFTDAATHWRPDLRPGDGFQGPALVIEPQTTTLVPAGFAGRVDDAGNLVLERREAQEQQAAPLDHAQPCEGLRHHVMWNRLQAVVDEQAGALMRTAFSPIVRESGDLSAGIFDRDGRMLAQAVTGTPGHVNTMATACAKFFDAFPRQAMRPCDLYLTNDPWLGAGHLNDFVLLKPCFRRERLIGFASCTSHLVDIGGRCLGPDGSDVFDEGLYVPPIKLLDEGRLNETFMALLKANSRMPLQAEGDVHALIACCEVGAERLDGMMGEFAIADLDALAEEIIGRSEDATRGRIRALGDACRRNVMTVDGYEREVRLQAELIIDGGGLRLDFQEVPGPSSHGINVPLNYTQAYTVFGLKCAIAPDIPNNHGSLAPFRVTAPAGSLLNARKPAPVCSRHILGQLLPDVALGCLQGLLPVPAEGAATLWDLPIRGRDGRGRLFVTELVHNGGTGARSDKDGLDATAFPSGVLGSLVEMTESTTPLLLRRRELRPDSGGPGQFRGGLGQMIELESADGSPFVLYGTVDRIRHPARGRASGKPGATGRVDLSDGRAFAGKGACEIPAGARLTVATPGGGGYGPPRSRDPDRVAADVADGLVSREAARRDYGVAVTAAGLTDRAETARLRGERESIEEEVA